MKKTFFILTAVFHFILIISQVNAQEASSDLSEVVRCDKLNYVPEIVFTTSYGKLNYDFSLNTRSLTELGQKLGIIEKGLFASGLATVGVNWELSVDTISRVLEEDDICVIPVKVNIFVGYEDPVIYISKELKPNTCEYNVVLRHEQTHQQINKLALEYFIPRLKKAVEAISKDIRPVEIERLSQIDETSEEISKSYIREISPLVEHFKKELFKEHGKLDNQDNYNYESNICKAN